MNYVLRRAVEDGIAGGVLPGEAAHTGAYSHVYAVSDSVVVKADTLYDGDATPSRLVPQMLRELQVASCVAAPGVVTHFCVLAPPASPGTVVLAMPRQHADLSVLRRDLLRRKARVGAAEALWLWAPVVRSVARAHARGFVHGDIKPHNMLVACDGAAAIDWGLASGTTDLNDAAVARGGAECYMHQPVFAASFAAPEALVGKHYGRPADVWALGIVLAWLFKMRTPFADHRGRRPDRVEDMFVGPPEVVKLELMRYFGINDSHVADIVVSCVQLDAAARPTVHELLRLPRVAEALAAPMPLSLGDVPPWCPPEALAPPWVRIQTWRRRPDVAAPGLWPPDMFARDFAVRLLRLLCVDVGCGTRLEGDGSDAVVVSVLVSWVPLAVWLTAAALFHGTGNRSPSVIAGAVSVALALMCTDEAMEPEDMGTFAFLRSVGAGASVAASEAEALVAVKGALPCLQDVLGDVTPVTAAEWSAVLTAALP